VTNRRWWARALLRAVAPGGQVDDVLGDLEEAHERRLARHGAATARILTTIETFEMAAALVRARAVRFQVNKGSSMLQDYKLGLRMLVKHPGLTIAGGLALAIAIGIGAGWYDLSRDLFRPTLPLPGGERLVEIEMRDAAGGGDERRLAHDFLSWRRDARTVEELGAYRTLERNLILGGARPEPVTVAEITASAFRLAAIPPLVGRPLLESDEQPGAPPVVVIGYRLWQQRFGGTDSVIGRTVQFGRANATVVGVMPEGFAFPVNHRAWMPLHLDASANVPIAGPAIRVFGRLAAGATQAQANAELTSLVERAKAVEPQKYEHLRPRVLAYGGESPGDRTLLEFAIRNLPVLLMLVIACANVGTLIYARTATREGEIATRHALGASRARIVGQLFIEALVLAAVAAVVGLAGANWALEWGIPAALEGQPGGLPFWIRPGLKPTTVVYAAGLTLLGAGLLGILPALKATGRQVQSQLRNLGAGGSTLRFGAVWTSVMIAQVALTVILIPPAFGISQEALRDRRIRQHYPAEQYLAVRVGLDRDATAAGDESDTSYSARFERVYGEFERRIAQEPGVRGVTLADRLPGMQVAVRRAEFEASPGAPVTTIPDLWLAGVGSNFFEAFDVPLTAGRDFDAGDRTPEARTVIVNEAFARRYTNGESPVGRRVRFASALRDTPEPWFEIVGMVRDVGMTPTDLGEAPYLFRAVGPATAVPLIMGVRGGGDHAALAQRVRAIAADLDPSLRVDEVQSLDRLAWKVDLPAMIAAGAIVLIVALGLFLSAAGIFSLMSVSVARRTREIGLRAALGASPRRLLAGIFSRALALVGSGIAAGNGVLLLFVTLSDEVALADVLAALLTTSTVMLVVGLMACAEPARRATRIQAMDALKEF
jgi:predicted permease